MKMLVNTTKLATLTSISLIIMKYDLANKTKMLEKDDSISFLNYLCFSEVDLRLML